MFKDLLKSYIYPIAIFSGGMIGVGFLSLPYVAMKAGMLVMFLYFLAITSLILVINLIFCQISLKTPDFKRAPGFAGYHLGKFAKIYQLFSTIFSLTGVLLIYLIVAGNFLYTALDSKLHWGLAPYVLIYFLIASAVVFFDIKVIAKVEIIILTFLLLAVLLIFVQGFGEIKISNIFSFDFAGNANNLFLPYGVLLFSLWGVGLVPQVEELLQGQKEKLKKIAVISTLIVSIFYLLFTLLILGISGSSTTQTAIDGLGKYLGNSVTLIALLAGVLATFTGFIMQGTYLKKVFVYDLKIKHWQAFVFTCFPAIILFLLGLRSLLPLISFIGGILLSIDGILIALIYKKIGGSNLAVYSLSFIFLLGLIYEIVYFIK